MFDLEWEAYTQAMMEVHDISMSNVPSLREAFEKNKSHFFSMFPKDGRLSVPLPVEALSKDEVIYLFDMEWTRQKGLESLALDRYLTVQNSLSPETFLNLLNYRLLVMVRKFLALLAVEDFQTNKLSEYSAHSLIRLVSLPSIGKGMKLSKAFITCMKKGLADESDEAYFPPSFLNAGTSIHELFTNYSDDLSAIKEELFAKIIDRLSQVLSVVLENMRNRKANLVLSVNPLDILFASTYVSGWTSCYRMWEPTRADKEQSWGCYVTAPLSYVSDKNTLIAYTTERTTDCQGYPVPVKNWRAFVHVFERKTAWIGRHYKAYSLHNEIQLIEELLIPKILKPHDVRQFWIKNPTDAYPDGDPFIYADELTCFVCPDGSEPIDPKVGVSFLACARCGQMFSAGENGFRTDSLLCGDCDGTQVCACCERRGTDFYDYEGDWLCPDCYRERVTICSICDDDVNRNDVIELQNGCLVCQDCFDSDCVWCSECGDGVRINYTTRVGDDFYCSDCANSLLVTCDDCGKIVERRNAVSGFTCYFVCSDCAETRRKEREEQCS